MLVLLTSGKARLNKWLHTGIIWVVGRAGIEPATLGLREHYKHFFMVFGCC